MTGLDLDPYVVDTLMPDLVGHDRQPSAFLLYLLLWRLTHGAGAASAQVALRDYLRGDGKPQIDRILSSDTPLWQILDKGKSTAKWNAFLRGSDQSLQFPLGLMAFRHWYAMYFESM